MAADWGIDRMTCPRCGVIHDVKWYRMTVREPQMVRCNECLAVMFQGRVVQDFVSITTVSV